MSAVLEAREPSARYLKAVQPLLVRQFELLATAPGGVTRLRELILALAVQGKVVQQDPGDEPASELLRRIRSERTALIAARSIKQGKPSEPISPEEEPCTLPRGWAWVRFGDLIHELCTGPFGSLIHKEDYVSGGVPLINPSHMIDGRIEHDPAVSVSASMASQLSAYRLSAGDVLLARRGEMGRYALVTEREAGWLCGTGSFFLKLSEAYDRRFFGLTLEDPRLRRHLLGESVGATMTNLNQRILLDVVVAVAPLAEQARIVARVDELMRLCDALETMGRLEAEQHARLLGALLGTLTDSSTPEELAANWQRVADHFDLLLDRPEAVDALEQVILQLGLRGVLLPSPSLDGLPTAHGQQRSLQDDLFAWPTARFGDVLTDLRYGTSAKCSYARSGTPVLRIPNLHDGAIDISDLKFGDLEPKEADSLRLEVGDLLIIRSNGSAGLVGTAALVSSPLPGFAFAGYLVRGRLDRAKVVPHFMALVMKSPDVRRQIEGPIRTTSGVKNINSTEIQRISFTLPPLEVQDLIVHTVTELRRLCANLQERLDRCNAVKAALADALIYQALVA